MTRLPRPSKTDRSPVLRFPDDPTSTVLRVMAAPKFWWLAVGGTVAAAAIAAGSPRGADFAAAAMLALATMTVIARWRRRGRLVGDGAPPRPRCGWLLVAVGAWGQSLGEGIRGSDAPSFLTPGDVVQLCTIPVVVAGILLLIRDRVREHDLDSLLEAVLPPVTGVFIVWLVVLEPRVDVGRVDRAVAFAGQSGRLR